MTLPNAYYLELLDFARAREGSYRAVGERLGTSGPSLQRWRANGAPHRWRPVIEETYGDAFLNRFSTVDGG